MQAYDVLNIMNGVDIADQNRLDVLSLFNKAEMMIEILECATGRT